MKPVLAAEGISKTIGGRPILRDVSFSFAEGGRYLLLGANGAGKTTLLKILSSLMRPTRGKVFYRGMALESDTARYLRELSFLSHETLLYEEMTGLENLSFYANLYGVATPREEALRLGASVGLRFFLDEAVRSYSHGMKKRLEVARSVIHGPRILLLDEPFAGLDPGGTQLLAGMIEEIHTRAGGLLILTTHDHRLGWTLADQYLYLERGRIVSWGRADRFGADGIASRLGAEGEAGPR